MSDDQFDWEGRAERWKEKVWGLSANLWLSREAAISILRVKKGFRCSCHYHRTRRNFFLGLAGVIEVWEWHDVPFMQAWPEHPSCKHLLKQGDSATVPAGSPHFFRVLESGLVVEIYTPDGGPVEIEDIVRFDCGQEDEYGCC
jgi:mannose-6-phosphate isomerase-like protein (cupin superfamily)